MRLPSTTTSSEKRRLQDGHIERKDQEYEAESSQKATLRRSRTKTPSTPLHQCSRHSEVGSRDEATSLQNFYTHPSQRTTTVNNVTSTSGQRTLFTTGQQDKIWRPKKAMCGLRSSPKEWQDYLAEVLQRLSFVRLKSEPSVYTNATRDCYIMVYVDDLLVLGDKTTEASSTQAHWLPRAWQTTTIPGKKHRPLWQLLQPWTKGLLQRQHDRGVWKDQLQHGDHSRNRPLQTNNTG